MMKIKQVTYLLILSGAAFLGSTQMAEAATLKTIATGLDQPRGFAVAADGTFYIPEPGVGGNGNCQPSPSTLFQPICAGTSGAITRVTPGGVQERIFTGYESLAEQPAGTQGAGPSDIAFNSSGDAYFLTGFAGYPGNRDEGTFALSQDFPLTEAQLAVFPPSPADQLLNTSDLAKLYEFDLETGEQVELFDFAIAEITLNPDEGDVVTNPYDLEIVDDIAYVVDGGGNSAYKINLDGSGDFEVFAIPDLIVGADIFETLPPPPAPPEGEVPQPIGQPAPDVIEGEMPGMPPEGGPNPVLDLLPGLFEPVPGRPDLVALQSVSTGAAVGPDGAFYVGEYTGFPYPFEAARIHRISPEGELEVFADGFNYITDIQFDDDGNLYVLQFSDVPQFEADFANLRSSLVKLTPEGDRTTVVEPGEGLRSADGLAFGPGGEIYVANGAIGPGNGEIVEVVTAESVPEPTSILGLIAAGLGTGGVLRRKRKDA